MKRLDVLKRLAKLHGRTLAHEVAEPNVATIEQRRDWVKSRRLLPSANGEEQDARKKAAKKRSVDRAREKRRALCDQRIRSIRYVTFGGTRNKNCSYRALEVRQSAMQKDQLFAFNVRKISLRSFINFLT
jgi:hypothetical protein